MAQPRSRAFGCSAYTAAEAGQDVVEPHSEESDDPARAHEELYFVAAGHARFEIDGRTYDAPSGTYVFLPDPASQRHAVAVEPATTVLSFGGPPTFEPSDRESPPDDAQRGLTHAAKVDQAQGPGRGRADRRRTAGGHRHDRYRDGVGRFRGLGDANRRHRTRPRRTALGRRRHRRSRTAA